jgi:hypothetical protein
MLYLRQHSTLYSGRGGGLNEVRLHIVELENIVQFDDWTKVLGLIEGMFLASLL